MFLGPHPWILHGVLCLLPQHRHAASDLAAPVQDGACPPCVAPKHWKGLEDNMTSSWMLRIQEFHGSILADGVMSPHPEDKLLLLHL